MEGDPKKNKKTGMEKSTPVKNSSTDWVAV